MNIDFDTEDLRAKLTRAINSVSAENGSNTPDFILAEYLVDCLAAFDKASNRRESWYGKGLTIGGVIDTHPNSPHGILTPDAGPEGS